MKCINAKYLGLQWWKSVSVYNEILKVNNEMVINKTSNHRNWQITLEKKLTKINKENIIWLTTYTHIHIHIYSNSFGVSALNWKLLCKYFPQISRLSVSTDVFTIQIFKVGRSHQLGKLMQYNLLTPQCLLYGCNGCVFFICTSCFQVWVKNLDSEWWF